MLFSRRPKFTVAQRLMLTRLIDGEMSYFYEDAPVCMFDTEEEAEALAAVIKANSKKDDK